MAGLVAHPCAVSTRPGEPGLTEPVGSGRFGLADVVFAPTDGHLVHRPQGADVTVTRRHPREGAQLGERGGLVDRVRAPTRDTARVVDGTTVGRSGADLDEVPRFHNGLKASVVPARDGRVVLSETAAPQSTRAHLAEEGVPDFHPTAHASAPAVDDVVVATHAGSIAARAHLEVDAR